ncbi:M20 family metallo-hydrolase [Paratissierella segnis]|uniref:M20 family metallo-hydrolase n=1 Tax=Paratissierella segnis TaxID=2763679 RepID=A0A926IJA1_9FIRM|nr:M20 family metallo-hydrolase [Paratissierella segnis]MBC8587206.1 M20 family metallo-hydrolase [Paratissierella segnis]
MELEKSTDYLNYIMKRFYHIGADKNGGVTRLAYTVDEDKMHEELSRIGLEEGYIVTADEVGNTFLSLGDYEEYYLVGSHLDSVVNGGRYDGVLGVAVGLLLIKIIKEEKLNIPLKVVAFRCEESSNFMKSTLGSELITNGVNPKYFQVLKSKKGEKLEDIFANRGYNESPEKIKGVKNYLELHIEQGRILESESLRIGVVSAIAGNIRLQVKIRGLAEHSGATPMNLRQDALCGAAEIILGIEKIGQGDFTSNAVTTVGVIDNFPNSINVIPGEVIFSIDIRDGDNSVMEDIRIKIERLINEVCKKRNLSCDIQFISSTEAVKLDVNLIKELSSIAENLGIEHKIMPSGAGHDAMKLANITKTGMIFIPCKEGISHNPEEEARTDDAALGAKIILEYLKGDQQ